LDQKPPISGAEALSILGLSGVPHTGADVVGSGDRRIAPRVSSAALGLQDVPGNAISAQHELRQIGNVAEQTDVQLQQLDRRLLGLAPRVNQTQAELIAGMGVFTSKGMAMPAVEAILPTVAKAATAATADIKELSTTTFAMQDNLKVASGEVRSAIGVAMQAGQLGAFELRDMAQYFPALTAQAQALKMQGLPAVSQLGAGLQVALKGAGDPSQAFNNFNNFLSKLTSPETVKNFKDMGVDLEKEWRRIAASGKDPIEEMMALIQRMTKGNEFKMGELFGDQQVLAFLKPMMANLEEYRRIRDTSLREGRTGALIDRNYNAIMGTAKEQSKQLRINMEAVARAELERPLQRYSAVLAQINGDPQLQRSLFRVATGLLAVGAGSVVMGTAFKVFAPVLSAVGLLRKGFPLLRLGFQGAALAGGPAAKAVMWIGRAAGLATTQLGLAWLSLGGWIGRAARVLGSPRSISGLFRAVALGIRSVSLTMLANPVGLVVAGIVLGAILLYKYWRPISGFFRGLWRGFSEAAAPAMPVLRKVVGALSWLFPPIRGAMTAVRLLGAVWPYVTAGARAVWGWFTRLLEPVDDVKKAGETLGERWGRAIGGFVTLVAGLPGRMRAAGANILSSIWEGMKSMADRPVELIRRVVQRIRDHLPFSPAKEGPLRDIHRIRLVETIAEGVKPAPLVRAMRAATAATFAAAAPGVASTLNTPRLQDTITSARFEVAAGRAGGGGTQGTGPLVSVQYAPVYQLPAGAAAAPELLQQLRGLDAVHRVELQRLVERAVRDALAARELTTMR
jgi:TP901 family phage tail tape measure protein